MRGGKTGPAVGPQKGGAYDGLCSNQLRARDKKNEVAPVAGLDRAAPQAERSTRATHGGDCTEPGSHHSLSTPNHSNPGLRPHRRHFRSPFGSRM